MIDKVFAGAALARRRRERRGQILGDREIGKHLVALGNQHDAEPGDLVRRTILDPPPVEGHAAIGDPGIVDAEKAGDRPQCRRFAGTVGAENGDDLFGVNGKADALHRGDGAVIDDLEFLDLQQGGFAHLRQPATGRYLNGHIRK